MATRRNPLVQVFSGTKLVDSRVLNRLGVQVMRVVAARAIYNLRSVPGEASVKAQIEELRREGSLLLPDFLPADHFERLRRECVQIFDNHADRLTITRSGTNTVEGANMHDFGRELMPNTFAFFANPTMHAILEGVEKRSLDYTSASSSEYHEVQRLTQGAIGDQDPQTQLHSDTFFNTHRVWLYLDDVEIEDGPFVFVNRSHHLWLSQLYRTYAHSNKRNEVPSRRIGPGELERLGLEESIVTCPRNTLLIANTCGYHRRFTGEPGRTRFAIHLLVRANPFSWWRYRFSDQHGVFVEGVISSQ